MEHKEIVEHFGVKNQMDKLCEELAELIVATVKLKMNMRNKKNINTILEQNFAEEIADVEFLISQLKDYFNNHEDVFNYSEMKYERTKNFILRSIEN